ncbi:2546_t:CDS:1 [Ambispora leptoticha]|uniref:2546_t:CDS:1 n=1 Tax=Ambispora leptoticha TaxID=144679 RepID=A0A9N9CKI4_9GLOM|nr:2546_t:CDS:1 [Ambispora leptoticha]
MKRLSGTIFLSRQRFVLEATLLQDQLDFKHKQEIHDMLNQHKQEILDIFNQHKQEILKVQDQLQVRHKQEITLMKEKLQSSQNEKQDYITLYLKMRGNFNIRGVLEWIREQISRDNFGDYELLFLTPTASPPTKPSTKPLSESPTKLSTEESTEPPKNFSSAPDSKLNKLINHHEFAYYLKRICDINKTKENDVRMCISFLYHQVSKYAHGYKTDEVTIDERFFAPYEVLALGYIFKIYNIRYLYYDKDGKPAKFPFEI